MFDFSSACYNVMLLSSFYDALFVWRRFRQVKWIRSVKKNQIIGASMLKNLNRRYSCHHIIKFIGFISIYYVINLDIVSSFMIFSNLYFGSINLLQV